MTIIPTIIALTVLTKEIFIPAIKREVSYNNLVNHKVQTGDIIVFGDKTLSNEWRVLTVEGSRIFIVNQKCIIGTPPITQYCGYPYDIPDYLNHEYYIYFFSDRERAMICDTDYGKIFLLSAEEARTYFANNADRIAGSSRYETDSYFLRDYISVWAGDFRNRMHVNSVGAIVDPEYETGRHGIRPAMWLDMDAAV